MAKRNQSVVKPVFDFSVNQTTGRIEIILPIQTVSEANNFDHWTKKQKRHKKQKWWVELAFTQCKPKIPCNITLIRMAPRFLDADDNLRMAVKYIKDYIAAYITGDHQPGRADGSKLLTWYYDQIKSKTYAVKIIIEF